MTRLWLPSNGFEKWVSAKYVLSCNSIFKIQSIMAPFEFHPNQVFDERQHILDIVAKQYLEKATNDVHHLVPVKVGVNGNCLYNSIILLMNNAAVTTSELRGR